MLQLGLVGYPIKHSLSPWIHKRFLKEVNIQGSYKLYEVQPHKFREKIELLKKELDGFNITIPFKQKIIPFLDDLDETAKQSGAVNTAVKEGDRWIGYNTDGIGFVRSLREDYPHILKKEEIKVLILGAGGAARGILHALIVEGLKEIDIANRTIEHAERLVEDFSLKSNILSLQEAEGTLASYDLIIQTSSLGMYPREKEAIITMPKLGRSVLVCDIVYQPLHTLFLKKAEQAGAQILFGHKMLLFQALYAFEKWTATYPSVENLSKQLEEELKGS